MRRINQRLASTARAASKAHPAFTVVLAYRDFAHEQLGKKYCEELAEQLRSFGGLTEWKFEMLAIAAMSEIAALEAASARVMVVATSGEEGLPPAMKRWLERWCSRKRKGPAELVVILTWNSGCSHGIWPDYFQLREQTTAAGITLIMHPYDLPLEGEHKDHSAMTEELVMLENSLREAAPGRSTRKECRE